MKLQFATIEALIAIYVLSAAAVFIGGVVASNSFLQYQSAEQLRFSFAVHDFVSESYQNASLQSCLNEHLENRSQCMLSYEAAYAVAYQLSQFKVYNQSESSSSQKCYPIYSENSLFCIGD